MLFIFSLLGVIGFLIIILHVKNMALGVFHPVAILSALAIIDVFVPGLLWSVIGKPVLSEWKLPLNDSDLLLGMVYYIVFYLIMFAFIVFLTGKVNFAMLKVKVSESRLIILIILFFIFACGDLAIEISNKGGVIEWFWSKTKTRWVGVTQEEKNLLLGLFNKIPWRELFNVLVLVGLFFRNESVKYKYLLVYVFPMLALIFSFTTFFRGSILVLMLGMAFAEYARQKSLSMVSAPNVTTLKILAKKARASRRLIMLALVLFMMFGAVRSYFEDIAWDVSKTSSSYIPKFLVQGSGIDSISHIIKFYSGSDRYFYGKTYLDMLLLPIPRAVYTSKPEWYGIDDITRRMGWPASSQSAVTIPGESFANYSWAGLLMAPIFGLFFGSITRLCFLYKSGQYIFVYPGVMFYVLFVANWMSFTGIMNQLIMFIFSIASIIAVKNNSQSKFNSK